MKNLITTIILVLVLMASTTHAKTGLLVSDFTNQDSRPCTETKEDPKTDWGILITSVTGILITSVTGILITDVADTTTVDCGIIITD